MAREGLLHFPNNVGSKLNRRKRESWYMINTRDLINPNRRIMPRSNNFSTPWYQQKSLPRSPRHLRFYSEKCVRGVRRKSILVALIFVTYGHFHPFDMDDIFDKVGVRDKHINKGLRQVAAAGFTFPSKRQFGRFLTLKAQVNGIAIPPSLYFFFFEVLIISHGW